MLQNMYMFANSMISIRISCSLENECTLLFQGYLFHFVSVVQPEARVRIIGGEFSGRSKAADEAIAWEDQGRH